MFDQLNISDSLYFNLYILVFSMGSWKRYSENYMDAEVIGQSQ